MAAKTAQTTNTNNGKGGEETPSAPLTPKNFRNQPDMESFFRFIYENDLRLEALQILDEVSAVRKAKRKKD